MSDPGFSVIAVEDGQLAVQLDKPAYVSHRGDGTLTLVTPDQDLTLQSGDALIFSGGSLGAIWNPTDAVTSYIAGGIYSKPGFPIMFPSANLDLDNQGTSFASNLFATSEALEINISRVSLGAGETYGYSIGQHTLLLSQVMGEGLEQQKWANGNRVGAAHALLPSTYTFHNDGSGYYTLTNTSDQPVEAIFFGVSPASTSQSNSAAAPAASVETLFERELTQSELAIYQSDQWRWISMTQGTIHPGNLAIIVEGSPQAGNVGFNGLGVVCVTLGTLTANAAEGATVERGATGAQESADRSANVTLNAGDTLFVPPSTLPALWNASDSDATYVTGGVYTESNITPLNELGSGFTRGGITVQPGDLPHGVPITLFIQQVTIPSGASYAYAIRSETWLEAIVTGGELRQEKTVAWKTPGKPKTLVASVYSLHSDGPGDYTVMNDGTETVEISLFRVETQSSADVAATPVASREHEQSAN